MLATKPFLKTKAHLNKFIIDFRIQTICVNTELNSLVAYRTFFKTPFSQSYKLISNDVGKYWKVRNQ